MDRYKVTKEHAYEQAEYHEDVLPDLKKTLHAIRTHIHDELSLHAYTSQQAKYGCTNTLADHLECIFFLVLLDV